MSYDKITLPLIAIVKKFKAEMQKNYPGIRLSMTQLETLHYIKHNKQVLMKDLSEFLSITPPSVTSLTDKLVECGMIKREGGESDRRNITLSFTEKGNEMFERARKERDAILHKMINRLSCEEKIKLAYILGKMVKED